MALPTPSQELCFPTEVFLDRDFHVDEFVSGCRRRVTVEALREDLDSYFRTLKSAMVELINKDYADFVNLSANLVGMDKTIGNLRVPLGQLREEIMSIRSALEAAISATESKLARRAEIREKKATLQRLIAIMESVEKLERLLKITPPPSDAKASEIDYLTEREEFAGVVMERVASEFNRLQYNVFLTSGHPLVEELTPRIAVITSTLQEWLELSFRAGLEGGHREALTRTLQTYATIGRQQAAESMFQSLIVHPYMEKVVSPKALLTHPQGLSGVYGEVLRFIPRHCSLLLEITQARGDQAAGVTGFDFIVNAVWPEIVATVDTKASVIFAPGNPDTFHKNYTASMEFVSSFEGLCPSQLSVRRLRNHASFTSFMSKWSLPVYFQIRFQEIAGGLESSLSLPLSKAQPAEGAGQSFSLEVFHVLWRSLHQCWRDGVFLPALVHRFWKLSLQLMSRLVTWLEEISKSEQAQAPSGKSLATLPTTGDFLLIVHDCEALAAQVPQFYEKTVQLKLPVPGTLKEPHFLQESLEEMRARVQSLVPQLATQIVERVARLCMQSLEAAHAIPRLYRRTNREAPQKPSSYVSNILKPLDGMRSDFPDKYSQKWSYMIVEAITERYFTITSEVLTSVKRTEDSLLKLKRNRKSLTPALSTGMSDDNKIRLQLSLDIEEYASQVGALKLGGSDISSLVQLLEMGRTAKTTALSI